MSLYEKLPESRNKALELLKNSVIFKDLSEDVLQTITTQMIRRVYAAGVTLFHQGMPGTMMYMLESGTVRVFGVGLTGQEHTFTTFGPGNAFGELAVLDGKPRTASAISLEETVVWLMSKDTLENLLLEYPQISRAVINVLADRVRTAATHTESIIFQDVLGRLSYEILNLAERHGRATDTGIEIEMPLTQSDLASIVGSTRESANKSLKTLRDKGLIEMEGTRLIVHEPEGLRQIIQQRGR